MIILAKAYRRANQGKGGVSVGSLAEGRRVLAKMQAEGRFNGV